MSRDDANRQRRQALILALLPGLLLGCVYVIGFRPRLVDAAERVEFDLADALRQQPTEPQLDAALDRAHRLQQEVRVARAEKAARDAALAGLTVGAGPDGEGGVAPAMLVDLLLSGGMLLVSEEHGGGAGGSRTGLGSAELAQARRIELAGSYGQMLKTLDALVASGGVRVLEVTMKNDGRRPGVATWTLIVG